LLFSNLLQFNLLYTHSREQIPMGRAQAAEHH